MKIKIICTKAEKKQMDEDITRLQECVCNFLDKCPKGLIGCDGCLDAVVEWEVTDNE